MLESLFGGASKVLTLVRDVEASGDDIKGLEEEIKEVRRELRETQTEVHRVVTELALLKQEMNSLKQEVAAERRQATTERENFLLQLRIAAMEQERRLAALPPAPFRRRDDGAPRGAKPGKIYL